MSDFQQTVFDQLPEGSTMILCFCADWCGPCKRIYDNIDYINKHTKLRITKIDVDTNPHLTERYQIRNIPTIVKVVNDKVVNTLVGEVDRDILIANLS